MHKFEVGKGINAKKINENFEEVKDLANDNESSLAEIDRRALRKDGSNLTQNIVEEFNRHEVIVLSGSGEKVLTDNRTHLLTLTGNVSIKLPTPNDDMLSHTIALIVKGSNYTLYLGTQNYLNSPGELKTSQDYQVLYIYNKIDKKWYYCLGQ